MRGTLGAALVLTIGVVLFSAVGGRGSVALANIPNSITSRGVPQVGALYASAGTTTHTCTASVIHSSSGSLLVTAAHCVAGNGVGMVFAPEQRGAVNPLGRWTVTAAYVEPTWKRNQDPGSDLAFLRVAPMKVRGRIRTIEQVTGAYRFGTMASADQRVTVTGYPAGSGNDPITCATRVYVTDDFPSFNCTGFVGGTSGSPWVILTRRGPEIVGIIGGLHQGGCYDYTSYSSPLRGPALVAYARAARGAPADVAPEPGGDGC